MSTNSDQDSANAGLGKGSLARWVNMTAITIMMMLFVMYSRSTLETVRVQAAEGSARWDQERLASREEIKDLRKDLSRQWDIVYENQTIVKKCSETMVTLIGSLKYLTELLQTLMLQLKKEKAARFMLCPALSFFGLGW